MGTEGINRPGHARTIASAALLLAGVIACPAHGATRTVVKRPAPGATLILDADGSVERLRPNTLNSFAPDLIDSSKFSFTAPGAATANARTATVERAFRFTPSGKVDNRRAFSVGVTSRVVAPVVDTSRAAAVPAEVAAAVPAAYNVDLAAGWRGFAVSGGYARSESTGALPQALSLSLTSPRREAVDAGVSYRGASWKTSIQVAAEEGPALLLNPLAGATATSIDRRYSLDVGGAYSLTPQLSVNGGVKVKQIVGPADPLRRDEGVYLGTAFTF